jgi:ribosomal-protein-alanine N-acetyltransferase
MSPPRLLDASNADFAALSEVHGASFFESWSAESLRSSLSAAGSFAFVEGNLDAFILARTAADEAEILTLAVRPGKRRLGLGRALVVAAAEHACVASAVRIFLEVGKTNDAARALYEGLGFSCVGERRGYYGERGERPEDALTMAASLPLAPLGKSGGLG